MLPHRSGARLDHCWTLLYCKQLFLCVPDPEHKRAASADSAQVSAATAHISSESSLSPVFRAHLQKWSRTSPLFMTLSRQTPFCVLHTVSIFALSLTAHLRAHTVKRVLTSLFVEDIMPNVGVQTSTLPIRNLHHSLNLVVCRKPAVSARHLSSAAFLHQCALALQKLTELDQISTKL